MAKQSCNKLAPVAAACAMMIATTVGVAHGAIIVTPGHIVSGSPTGALVAIDTPFISGKTSTSVGGGPTWTTAGSIFAHQADQGFFANATNGLREYDSNGTPWEPDGTPFSQARGYFTYNAVSPNTTWTFNLLASGVDIPDGSVINGIYARHGSRGSSDRALYQYTEGAQVGSVDLNQFGTSTSDIADLVLSWTDDVATSRNSNFRRIFSTPIIVEGANGFQLRISDLNTGNAAHIDAVVLDVSGPAAASFASPAPTNTLNLNIGTFDHNSGIQSINFSIFNLEHALGGTLDLDLDSFLLTSLDDPNLSTNLALFTGLDEGMSNLFSAMLDTMNIGSFTETYELQLSSTGITDLPQTLTLTLSGNVQAVPEPAALAIWSLLALGLAGFTTYRARRTPRGAV